MPNLIKIHKVISNTGTVMEKKKKYIPLLTSWHLDKQRLDFLSYWAYYYIFLTLEATIKLIITILLVETDAVKQFMSTVTVEKKNAFLICLTRSHNRPSPLGSLASGSLCWCFLWWAWIPWIWKFFSQLKLQFTTKSSVIILYF